jgi:hypothetical protein
MKKLILVLLVFLVAGKILLAENITGSACYRYSDNESINDARDIALSMAKRDALEKNAVFVSSTSTVQNMTLMNDLISSLTAGVLKNLRITKKTEDPNKKEVCRNITANVEPIEIKQRIVSKINTYKQKHSNFQTGLPENNKLKVLKVVNKNGELKIIAKCKIKTYPYDVNMRLTYYDDDGIPEGMSKMGVICKDIGDIIVYELPYNTPDYSFEIVD